MPVTLSDLLILKCTSEALRQPDSKYWATTYDPYIDRQVELGAWKLVPSDPALKPFKARFFPNERQTRTEKHSVRYAA